MDYKKIRQESISFFILLFVALAILVASALYIRLGILEDTYYYTIGGAIFAFVSFYAIIIYIKRLSKVDLARRVGDIMLYDRLRSVKEIADKIKKPKEKVQSSIYFLINNNYISNFKLDGDIITNEAEERRKRENAMNRLQELTASVKEVARDYAQSVIKSKKKHSGRCSGCGAVVVFSDSEAICPYCGNLIKSDK